MSGGQEVGKPSGNQASNDLVTATGSTTARALKDRWADVVNVKDFGATGDGTTDDTAVIQAAIATAKAIYFPKGTYKVTGLTAVAGAALLANGDATISLAVGSTVALTIAVHNVTVRGLRFDGGNVGPWNVAGKTVGTRSGISIPSGSVYGVTIEDCYATGFDAYGLYISSTAQAQGGEPGTPPVNVTGFAAYLNFTGIMLDALGEYVQITNSSATQCYAAMWLIGGNNRVVNSHFSKSYRNLVIRSGTNSHHGSFTGCSFNHAAAGGLGVDSDQVVTGMLFTGCEFWYSPIQIQNSGGMVFTGCQIGQSAIVTTRVAAGYNSGTNAFIGNWLYAGVTLTFDANLPTTWRGNVWDGLGGGYVALTYSASIAVNASYGEHFSVVVTDGNALTIQTPTNVTPGARMIVQVLNANSGAMGVITWPANFKMAAWTNPAPGYSRSIVMQYRGVNWYEVARTPADVPN